MGIDSRITFRIDGSLDSGAASRAADHRLSFTEEIQFFQLARLSSFNKQIVQLIITISTTILNLRTESSTIPS